MANNPVWIYDAIAAVTAVVITIVVTPLVRRCALRWKLGDKPNGRKIHTSMIPHLGGIAIVMGTIGGVAVAAAASGAWSSEWSEVFERMLPPVGLIVLLGLVDDMKSLHAVQKLAVQLLSATVLALSGFLLYTGVAVVDTSSVVVLVVSVIFLVGVSSSVNLIDGHDGLAAGISLISAAAFAVVALDVGSHTVFLLSVCLACACLGFLVFNFPPGKIFMGDTGSMFLGIVLALLACSLTIVQPTARTFVAICFALGVPMLDAWLAIARRLILRAPIFKADSLHMHHVLRQLGFTPKQTLLLLYTVHAFLAVLAALVLEGLVFPIVLGFVVVAVCFGAFLRVMIASRGEVAASSSRVTPKMATNSIPPLKSNLPRQNTSLGR